MTESCFCPFCGTPNKSQFRAVHTAFCDSGRYPTKLCPFCPDLSHISIGEYWEHLMQYHTEYLPSEEYPTVAKLVLGSEGEEQQLFDSTFRKESNEETYICKFCSRKFDSFALFDLHAAIFHNDRWDFKRSASGFACSLCGLVYSSCVTLRQHWLIIHLSSPDGMPLNKTTLDVLKLLSSGALKPVGEPKSKRRRKSPLLCSTSSMDIIKHEQMYDVQIKEESAAYDFDLNEQIDLRPESIGSSSSRSSSSNVPSPSQILMVNPSKGTISSVPVGFDAAALLETSDGNLSVKSNLTNAGGSSELQVSPNDHSYVRGSNIFPKQISPPAVRPQPKSVLPDLVRVQGRSVQPSNVSIVIRGGSLQVVRAPRMPPLQPRPNVYFVRMQSSSGRQITFPRAPAPALVAGPNANQISPRSNENEQNKT